MPGPFSGEASHKFRSLPRRARFALTMIGFFFLINLFSGLDNIWFQWPSIPFILMLIFSLHARDKSSASSER